MKSMQEIFAVKNRSSQAWFLEHFVLCRKLNPGNSSNLNNLNNFTSEHLFILIVDTI